MKQKQLRRLLAGIGFAFGAALAQEGPHEPHFADVPPCHWAFDAVNRLADTGIFIGFPPEASYLSVNALRQVFEGLRCEDPAWSLRFLDGAPIGFGEPPTPTLVGFTLEPVLAELTETRAVIDVAVSAVLERAGERTTEAREGRVTVLRDGDGWRVVYGDLAALELPLFPAHAPGAAEAATLLTLSASFRENRP